MLQDTKRQVKLFEMHCFAIFITTLCATVCYETSSRWLKGKSLAYNDSANFLRKEAGIQKTLKSKVKEKHWKRLKSKWRLDFQVEWVIFRQRGNRWFIHRRWSPKWILKSRIHEMPKNNRLIHLGHYLIFAPAFKGSCQLTAFIQ